MAYRIRDIALAPQGEMRIHWVRQYAPLLTGLEEDFRRTKPLEGLRVAVSIHLEAKTALLARVLAAAGAEVAVTGSNPLSTQDAVAAALAKGGLAVYAWHDATPEEYQAHLVETLSFKPHLILDDGGDFVELLEQRSELASSLIGGCEETTTGIRRLHARKKQGKLSFPMMAVNDAKCKHYFDNRYGTGQSVWEAMMHMTNLLVAGKAVVVAGYGWCGRGVARRAQGLGARVIVCEIDPICAMEAICDGFEVMPMMEAAPIGDIFVTVTGCCDVIGPAHFMLMKEGALLSNAGHFDVEVAVEKLKHLAVSHHAARLGVDGYTLPNGRQVFLLAQGRLVNLAAGNGHPVEIMDLSFAVQALSLLFLAQNGVQLKPGVYPVPDQIDQEISRRKLEALGVRIDSLTPYQAAYLDGVEGTV